jgi:hypothetical protein
VHAIRNPSFSSHCCNMHKLDPDSVESLDKFGKQLLTIATWVPLQEHLHAFNQTQPAIEAMLFLRT